MSFLRHVRSPSSFAIVAVSFLASCAAHRPPPGSPSSPAAGAAWTYDVVANADASELRVEAAFADGSGSDLSVGERAAPFVRDVSVWGDGAWRAVPANAAGTWSVPECTSGCRVRYRFELRAAAEALADVDGAVTFPGGLEAPPSTWLLRPEAAPHGALFSLAVRTPPQMRFVSGLYRDASGQRYEAEAEYLAVAPYSAFGDLDVAHPDISTSVDFEVAVPHGWAGGHAPEMGRWVARAARAASSYFGCFPVPRVMLLLLPVENDQITKGHALGDGGAGIVVEIGRDVRATTLERDWILPHEMVHMGFPSVSRRHHWMEEGVAVYVQPIARARVGQESPEEAWRELASGLPKGEPRAFDRGLDNTPTWARTYWGGALFCLLADLEIRERTGGRASFADALRGIVREGGNIAEEWDFDRVLDAGDRATGVPVLRELYGRMGNAPLKVDIDGILRSLGVVMESGGRITFDDDAPRASVRRAIMQQDDAASVTACPAQEGSVQIARNASGAYGSKGAAQR